MSQSFHSPLARSKCIEALEASSLSDGNNEGNSFPVSHWTLVKGGPLVRGEVILQQDQAGTRISLTTKPNYYRLLAPMAFILAITCFLCYRIGFQVLPSIFQIWILPFSALALIQAAFIPWAKKKLLRALQKELLGEPLGAD